MRGATTPPRRSLRRRAVQSTLPVRGATSRSFTWQFLTVFQSTLPVRGATEITVYIHKSRSISIHAPRAGSDATDDIDRFCCLYFNPRSPCGERPLDALPARRAESISIHAPRAGSDDYTAIRQLLRRNFNPRSPCGERPLSAEAAADILAISIHAPRAGSDLSQAAEEMKRGRFQSTLPVRGATRAPQLNYIAKKDFNPRSPCGERQKEVDDLRQEFSISIHAPRAGSDTADDVVKKIINDFNPRSPCGERPRES